MMKIDEIVSINRKLANINYTNSEIVDIIKSDDSVNLLNKVVECEKQFPDDNNQFLNCCSSVCPTELQNFRECVKINKGQLGDCIADSMKFEKCMTGLSSRLLMILAKNNSYKV